MTKSPERSPAHPKELLAFLEQIGAAPKKSLSQNFLIDANILQKMVRYAGIVQDDHVLEIGPGPGALTQALLQSGARVIAIETDRKFARALPRLQIDGRLQIFESDFLNFSIMEHLSEHAPLKVVANLPYHITTPIIERLCDHSFLFSGAWIMVQKELADRMVAQPGSKAMSSLSIFLQTYCKPSIAFNVSCHCFYPEPQVDSCVIQLDFRTPPMNDPKPFLSLVRRAFQQRRKMLRSTIAIQQEPFARKRPEALSFDEWIEIYRIISEKSDSSDPSA
jgi:16S rRNA (adenine1518-N6/adenine1519-N6)-dimethyltransferase